MSIIRLIAETIGYYILMYLLIIILIPEGWRSPLITLSGMVISVSFFIALFQLLFGDPGWSFLNTIRRRAVTGMLILIGILTVLGLGLGVI